MTLRVKYYYILNFKIHNVQFGLSALKFIKMYFTFDDDENYVFISM